MTSLQPTRVNATATVKPVKARLCSNPVCRQPGHDIRKCDHPSIAKMFRDTQRISDFSVAYNYPVFIKTWIQQMISTSRYLLLGRSEHCAEISQGKLFKKYYSDILAEGPGDTVRSTIAARISPEMFNRLKDIMNSMGIPTRLTPRQTLQQRVATANVILRESTTALSSISSRVNALMLEHVQAERVREASLSNYFRVHDELEEYARTHDVNGLLIPRKFEIMTLLKVKEDGEEMEDVECPLCYDMINEETVELNCQHKFCKTCISRYFDTLSRTQTPCCSLCRVDICDMTFNEAKHMREINVKFCSNC